MAILKIPSPLRTYTAGEAVVEVEGVNVAQAMESLVEQHPDLRQHLFNGHGELRPFVNLYLNSEDIRHLDKLATPIQQDDRLMIVPSIAGGLIHSPRNFNHGVPVLIASKSNRRS